MRHFGEALELAPRDRPSRIFLDRCRYYQANSPTDDWNGVWIMEQKERTRAQSSALRQMWQDPTRMSGQHIWRFTSSGSPRTIEVVRAQV